MTSSCIEELTILKGIEWKADLSWAREVLPEKLLSDKSLERLVKNSELPSEFNSIIKSLYQDSTERPGGIAGIDYFLKVVNQSNYSLKDWIKALHYFNQWLLKENRSSPFLKQLGFLQCCEESPEHRDRSLSFLQLVEDMLSEHGFVG